MSDGTNPYPREAMFSNVAAEERDTALQGYVDEDGMVPSTYHCLLVRSGDRVALIDAGLGDLAGPDAPVGKLQGSLREAGVGPGDVDVVVISHGHADHIGGLTMERDGARVPTYGRARHHVWQSEWDFWTSPAADALPEMLLGPARMTFPVLEQAGLVEPVGEETDVLPGVRLLPAPGHTPGHAVVAITSGGEGLLYVADAVVHQLDFEHPEWLSAFDAIPNLTVQTRRRLLDRAAQDGSPIVAFHVGYGHVTRANGAYRFQPS
ncbi:MAG: MBL fold metallo-hydrolase [Actinomycetota bacterium]|nr:MBL fold metallo-hydrolase [Actinomycetota bacterium]